MKQAKRIQQADFTKNKKKMGKKKEREEIKNLNLVGKQILESETKQSRRLFIFYTFLFSSSRKWYPLQRTMTVHHKARKKW